ncbi:dTDP-4-dehydrorhamnose reductase [Legionella sp.]|uniref:dTDP-4-dehydrorhamnose reductase n=1 Tax=Legionella sp. TaxID=459 RepID=UPI003CBEAA9E
MKILLLGKNGQLGWQLQRALLPLGEVITLDRTNRSSLCGDLSNLDGLKQTIHTLDPQIIVNAAAYTAVDKAESEPELARLINAQAPEVLAREAAALGSLLVHYSSDYVFDGSGNKPWQESDPAAPLNHYGQSKLEGEQAIQASGCRHLIFRTSWIYSTYGNNFAKTVIRLAREREVLHIVNDQIGVPTNAATLADITAHALRTALQLPEVNGLYHVAPQGEVSWYDYANFVIKEAQDLGEVFQVQNIVPISSADYVTPAMRPYNSRLDTSKFSDTFSLRLPYWECEMTRVLKEILLCS